MKIKKKSEESALAERNPRSFFMCARTHSGSVFGEKERGVLLTFYTEIPPFFRKEEKIAKKLRKKIDFFKDLCYN